MKYAHESTSIMTTVLVWFSRSGPGPAKYMLPPTLGYEVHDARRWRSPAYSLAKRLGDNGPGICSPGPAHGIEPCMVRTGKVHNPTYVMGQRLDHGKTDVRRRVATTTPQFPSVG